MSVKKTSPISNTLVCLTCSTLFHENIIHIPTEKIWQSIGLKCSSLQSSPRVQELLSLGTSSQTMFLLLLKSRTGSDVNFGERLGIGPQLSHAACEQLEASSNWARSNSVQLVNERARAINFSSVCKRAKHEP